MDTTELSLLPVTPTDKDPNDAAKNKYATFYNLLQSTLHRDADLASLYNRTLALETATCWASLILVPLCLLAGLLGNLTTLVLMLRSRTKWSKPHVYIACLLPTNAVILMHQFFSQTVHRGLFSYSKGTWEFPMYPNDEFCAVWSFAMSSAGAFALLLMVALMLDRLHALTLPFSYRTYSLRFSRRVAAGLGLLSLGLSTPILPLYRLSRSLIFLDSGALFLNCFATDSPQRDIMAIYVTTLHRGGLVSVLMLVFNAFLAHRVRLIQTGKCAPTSSTDSAVKEEQRNSARVTLTIFSLSLFYTTTLTPAAAVLGIGTVYAQSSDLRESDTVAYYLNVTYWTNLGLLFNVMYAVFYGFNWIIYAKDVPFVRKAFKSAVCCWKDRSSVYTSQPAARLVSIQELRNQQQQQQQQ